ncbi:MAG: N-acetyl-gamma-glutamyl-phosphate reductase [Actinobacteria bacterium]|nr:N-acetyl-gamma-glutamyl-phosphate reductase [Actinomycetota bacterium]
MKTAIVGASGYTGGELLRLLSSHPFFTPTVIAAHTQVGQKISSLHPHLSAYGERTFVPANLESLSECDVVFLALPHGESGKIASYLLPDQIVVDLGADFRLKDASAWSKYYGGDHAGTWTYGLPELSGNRELISDSRKVANPGCYATAISLSCAPALAHINTSDIVVVAASGTTGAGRSLKASLLASEVSGSLSSYKFGGVHQHTPEIEEALTSLSGNPTKISFTPILAPMSRGILATVTAQLTSEVSVVQLRRIYSEYYENEYFVTVLDEGRLPRTASLTGSNHVQIQIAIDTHTNRLIVSTAIDNLGKGAAGQAIQNANLMAGLEETIGLTSIGLGI